MKTKATVLAAMQKEVLLQQDFLPTKKISSIYFGGGTPSVLTAKEISALITQIQQLFEVDDDAEITLEANPDDLSKEKLEALFSVGVNRLSIGVQSFFDEDLKWMNRAHNAKEALQCFQDAKEIGFTNFTLDLIYGMPTLSNENWEKNIKTAISLGANHISAYCLTVEEKTVLHNYIQKGVYQAPSDEQGVEQFNMLIEALTAANYQHYEISNFAKAGFMAKHNSAYWKQEPYLGIGPGAHGFDGENRKWNISNNALYAKKINQNEAFFEMEELTEKDRYNEYIMTSLRTSWGINIAKVNEQFNIDLLSQYSLELNNFRNENWISIKDTITLTQEGKSMADHIASVLFLTD